uniref:Uncharacterized protein n=1 Tax=Myoviridae sp. ctbEa13 TaxID=2825136 RepID=A0A8S5VBA1_9CAUD|nr:MAG TPA: hypothetical protein [Myoviridae sp. ctbEa13]
MKVNRLSLLFTNCLHSKRLQIKSATFVPIII